MTKLVALAILFAGISVLAACVTKVPKGLFLMGFSRLENDEKEHNC